MRSLRSALTIRLLLGGTLLLGMAGMGFQWRLRKSLVTEFDSGLLVTAHSLQVLIENENGKIRMETEAEGMPEFSHRGGASVYLLHYPDGREIQRSPSLEDFKLEAPAPTSSTPAFSEVTLPDHRRMRCVSLIARVDGGDHKGREKPDTLIPVTLSVGRDIQPLEHTLREIRNALAATGALTLGALVLLLLWGVRRGLAPVGKLVGDISKIDGRSLSTRLDPGRTPSELVPVVDRLNELLARLERTFEREKRFTADVSHELRTPLAELRALAEVNLLAPPASAHENSDCWSEVQSIALRMESLSIHLLDLARAEQPYRIPLREAVDMNALLTRTLERHATSAAAHDITFDVHAREPVTQESDPVLMELILSNLIGNVTHHAVPGSTCTIALERGTLKVCNAVSGLSPADLPHLFDRYWKSDRSRTDGRRLGLGLTLAMQAATLLGGTLEPAFDPQRSILTFILHFQHPASHRDPNPLV
ncbi:sensor histidine kinase [Luteolibacter soli]|uniref:histidine kinase n=1 Tax=Luteolibacter soli TaxID=3135280 RepID=A0ABU9AVF7_9BACT